MIVELAAALTLAAPPPKTLASYCSPSGDVCFGAIARRGAVRLELTTAARYFARYTLCVRPPARARRCGSFPTFRGRLGTWYSSVRLTRFWGTRPGVYRVTWRLRSGALGPTLRVRLPA